MRWVARVAQFVRRHLHIANNYEARIVDCLDCSGPVRPVSCRLGSLVLLPRGGSYLAIPKIVGFVGIYVAFQGVANVWRITKKTPPCTV